MKTKNPREAAFLAVLSSLKEETFIIEALEKWRQSESPSDRDYNLAQQIAYGSSQMALSLDYIAKKLVNRDKLKLKVREKVLIREAIYQHCYMDRVPIYAITNETMEIAKKYCHETFVKFLNALLRNLSKEIPELPKGKTVQDLSIRYSYPPYFVQNLIEDYSLEEAIKIMEAGNRPSPTMFRIRPGASVEVIKDNSLIEEIAQSPDYYIQNATPAALISTLVKEAPTPKRILDLCASPGGKLIAAHDCFPEAELFANDVSAEKLKPLEENCEKYGINPTFSSSKGENFTSDTPFDLIILDVPCSNSGVLNKRPEARWRLNEKSLEQLEEIQLSLLKHALTLLSDQGEIWFITCSVLKKENDRLIEKACQELNLKARLTETILPNQDGWDGGFATALNNKLGQD